VKARLKAGRWPSRSVSASTPSQSKSIASSLAAESVEVLLSEEVTTRPPFTNLPVCGTNADDDEVTIERRSTVNFIILYIYAFFSKLDC